MRVPRLPYPLVRPLLRQPRQSPVSPPTRRAPLAPRRTPCSPRAPYKVSAPISFCYRSPSSRQIYRGRASSWFLAALRLRGWTREAPCVGAARRAPLRGAARVSRLLRSTPRTCPDACRLRWRGVAALVTRRRCDAPSLLLGVEVVLLFSFPARPAVSLRYLRPAGARTTGSSLALSPARRRAPVLYFLPRRAAGAPPPFVPPAYQ